MAKRTVLEELVVVVTGNANHYHKMMASVNRTATSSANHVRKVFTNMTTPIVNAYRRALQYIRRSQIEFMAGIRNLPLLNNFGRVLNPATIAGRFGAVFGRVTSAIRGGLRRAQIEFMAGIRGIPLMNRMGRTLLPTTAAGRIGAGIGNAYRSVFNGIRSGAIRLRNDLIRTLTTGALGRAIYNFRVGARAGFTGMQGIGGRPFTHMATTAGSIGARFGAAGAIAYRPIGAAISAGAFTLPILRRAGYNLANGFFRGLRGQFRQVTTMGRIGNLMGRGVGMIGPGLSASASMIGRIGGSAGGAITRGVGTAGRFIGGGIRGTLGLAGGALRGGIGGVGAMISAASAGFNAMWAQGSAVMDKLTQRFRRLGYDFQFLGRKLSMYLTAPILAFGLAAVSAFAQFDDTMHTAMALMEGVGAATQNAMEQTAFGISSGTRTGPAQLAMGYVQLASAGFQAAEAMQALKTVEKFSLAGAFDVSTNGMMINGTMAMNKATEQLIGSQAALGLRVNDTAKNMENMTHVGDVLTKANMISQARVEDFAEALSNKAGAALRLLNKPMEEGVAVLAAYAAQNIKGATAGTKLDIVLRDLQRASTRNAEEWARMGITVFDGSGKFRDVADIIADLEKTIGGMSDEQKFAELTMLGFQDKSVAAVRQLLGMSDAIKQYRRQLNNADGSMQKVADIRLKSFTSQMAILRNQITIVGIEIGKMLVPMIMSLNGTIQNAIGFWNQLDQPMKQFLLYITLAVAGVGPLLVMFGVMSSVVGIMVSGFSALSFIVGTFFAFMTSWPILITGAIAATVAYLIGTDGLVAGFKAVIEWAANFGRSVSGFFHHFSENMSNLVSWFGDNWKNMFNDALAIVGIFFSNMAANTGVAIETSFRLWNVFVGWLGNKFLQLFEVNFPAAVLKGAVKAVNIVSDFSLTVATMLANAASGTFEGGKAAGIAGAGFLIKYAAMMQKDVKTGLTTESLNEAMKTVMDEQMAKMKGPLEGFQSTTTPLFLSTYIAEEIEPAIDPLKQVENIVSGISDDLETPMTATFQTKGLDALRAGTAQAFQELWAFRNGVRSPIDAIGAGGGFGNNPIAMGVGGMGGGPVALANGPLNQATAAIASQVREPMSRKDRLANIASSRAAKQKAYLDAKNQRRAAFLSRRRQRPKKLAGEDPVVADGSGLLGPEVVEPLPSLVGTRGSGTGVTQLSDVPVEDYFKEMVGLLSRQNEIMEDEEGAIKVELTDFGGP